MTKAFDVRGEFAALCRKAYLDILLPKDDAFDAIATLRDGSPEQLQRAASRKQLYFDEKTKLQLVLKTTLSKTSVEALLPHLELAVAAHASTADPAAVGNAAASTAKHDIVAVKNTADGNVEVVSVGDSTYAVWKQTLHLVQPRSKAQRPAIYFTANLIPLADSLTASIASEKDILPSYQPLPANVLEPLRFDASLSKTAHQIYLSETRVTKVSPSAPRLEPVSRPLRGATKRAFSVTAVTHTGLKYSPLPQGGIVSLHIETSKLGTGDLLIQRVALVIPEYEVELLHAVEWPQAMRAGDNVVLLFRLTEQSVVVRTQDADRPTLTIQAAMTLEDGTSISLETQRHADVDVSIRIAPEDYRWTATQKSTSTASSDMPSVSTSKPKETQSEVILNFTGNSRKQVSPGHYDVAITVQCVNRSSRDRCFALRPLPDKVAALSVATYPTRDSSKGAVEAVRRVSEVITWSPAPEPEVLILTPDVQTQLLTPGSSCELELLYRVKSAGNYHLGTVKVVDLLSKQSLIVTNLPNVLSEN